MKVYRIHIRPKGGLANPQFSFAYCLKEQVLGLGWQTNSQVSGISWEEYEKEAASIYGTRELSRVRYLKRKIEKYDLLWTRDTDSNYYLGRVLSGWEYYTNSEAQKADITNIVRCKLVKVPSVDDVPGKVVASFRPSRTIQIIRDNTALDYSMYLWNKISGSHDYIISSDKYDNVFSFLDSEEIEDVIFIYLQTKGWIVVPNSRKADTMSFEFYLINKDLKEKATVQVKSGNTALRPSEWMGRKEKVFLFQSNKQYDGEGDDKVTCIAPEEIQTFMYENIELMPSHIAHWLHVANGEKKSRRNRGSNFHS